MCACKYKAASKRILKESLGILKYPKRIVKESKWKAFKIPQRVKGVNSSPAH